MTVFPPIDHLEDIMAFEQFVTDYGIAAVLIGSGVEGETVAFLGGVLAHKGVFPYWQAALAAAVGSFLADQILFYLGRYASGVKAVKRLTAKPAMTRVTSWLEKHPNAFIFCFRFIYGIRTISPVAIGLSSISPLRFFAINLVSAATWGTVITAVGYGLGQAVETLIGRLGLGHHMAVAIIPALVIIAAIAFGAHHYIRSSEKT